jgi:carboxymethylenebutenolidase
MRRTLCTALLNNHVGTERGHNADSKAATVLLAEGRQPIAASSIMTAEGFVEHPFSRRFQMRRIVLLIGLYALLVACSAAAAPVKTATVRFKSGDETISGFLALPDSAGPHPAIVAIHEWWGLNDWVKEEAQKFAEQGYATLAVDLYRGKVAYDPALAHELMRGMPQDRAVRDLKAAFAYLASRPEVNPDKIGSIGWCMGGALSLQLAVNESKLAACVVNYGAMPTDPQDIQKIQAPVLGNFGADDRGIPASAVQAFEKAMKAAQKSIDVKIYEGAGHAFENPNNKLGYREDTAEDAGARTLAFFNRTLK